MTQPFDRLPARLADLADQVSIVDLHDRVLGSSRRLGRLRAAATAAVVVVALTLGAGIGTLVRRDLDGAPVPPAGRSAAASPTAAPPTSGPSTPATGVPLGGTVFFAVGGSTPTSGLYAWRPGHTPVQVVADFNARQTGTVSPDGRHIAWMSPLAGPGGQRGRLHVANPDGSGDHVVGSTAYAGMCPPAWAPDSRHVLVEDNASNDVGHPYLLDTRTGSSRRIAGAPLTCFAVWSADGSTIALIDLTDSAQGPQLATMRPDGTHLHIIPGTTGAKGTLTISPDGSRLVTFLPAPGQPGGDLGRTGQANVILDVATGRAIALPVAGQLYQALYLPDGRLLLELHGTPYPRMVLVSASGRVLAQADVPASVKDELPVGYIPGHN